MIPVGTKVELHGVEFLVEKKIQGSNMGSNQFRIDMPRYVDMYLQGRLKLDELVSARLPLDEINEGFDGDEGRRGRPQRHHLRLTVRPTGPARSGPSTGS